MNSTANRLFMMRTRIDYLWINNSTERNGTPDRCRQWHYVGGVSADRGRTKERLRIARESVIYQFELSPFACCLT